MRIRVGGRGTGAPERSRSAHLARVAVPGRGQHWQQVVGHPGAPAPSSALRSTHPNDANLNGTGATRHYDSRVAELIYFTGPMDCGKSTLALQMDYTHTAGGRKGRLFTSHDRAGERVLSSRLGLARPAVEVRPEFDFWHYVIDRLTGGDRIDYLVGDEAQFYTAGQVDQLARIVDELQIDVFAVGILTDFQTRLFPARSGWSSSATGSRCCRSALCAGAATGPPTTPVRSTGRW